MLLKKYYFTVTAAQYEAGPGCVEVCAMDASHAREKMWNMFGSKWAFQYTDLESVHPADRKIIVTIH